MKIDNFFIPDTKIFENKEKLHSEEVKTGGEEGSFLATLKQNLDSVNEKQIVADEATEKFVKGEDTDVHEVMLTAEEARMSLELAVQMRNKLVEAYQELNRMPV